MDYVSIFNVPPLNAVLISIVQGVALYLMVLIGLKCAGRRMFAEMGAQDFVVLLMVSDAANLGLTHNDGGFWSSVASVATIIALGSTIERIPVLRKLVDGKPRILYDRGRINAAYMKRYHIEIADLDEAARSYGLGGYKDFEKIVLESDGDLTGVVRKARTVKP